jgi:tellurite resistance protein TerA
LTIAVQQIPVGYNIDLSCFALGKNARVRGDDDFIFFNNASLGNALILRAERNEFEVNTKAVPADIEKLAFCLTLSEGQRLGHRMDALQGINVSVSGGAPLTFQFPTSGRTEVALILAEIYRRNNEWKFRALGQGFNGGLQPLAEHFGVTISQGEGGSAPPQAPQPAPAINLSKITLKKTGDKISLEKKGGSLGEISINLNWNTGVPQSSGLLGSLLGAGNKGAIDLDLGCLFELQDGDKGAVQALGNAFGRLVAEPWIELDGDDRTGSNQSGETLRINGHQWNKIRRVLVYAFIYEGTLNWAAANGRVLIKTPGQPYIEVLLDNPSKGEGMCAIALLENVGGKLEISKQVSYFRGGHSEMDKAYRWGLRWKAGSK